MFTILKLFGGWLAKSPFVGKLIEVVGPALRYILLATFALGVIYLCFLNIKTTYDTGVSAKRDLQAASSQIADLKKKLELSEKSASRAQDAVASQCASDKQIEQKAEGAKQELARRFPRNIPPPYVPASPASATPAGASAASEPFRANQSYWIMQELSNQFCSADKTYCEAVK